MFLIASSLLFDNIRIIEDIDNIKMITAIQATFSTFHFLKSTSFVTILK